LGANGSRRKFDLKSPDAASPRPGAAETPKEEKVEETRRDRVAQAYVDIPLQFEWDCEDCGKKFDFLSRGAGFDVFVGPGEVVLHLRRPELEPTEGEPLVHNSRGCEYKAEELSREIVLRMKIRGLNPDSEAVGRERSVGGNHYFLSNDPREWLIDVPTYKRIEYVNIYPGIDLAFYGDQNRFEYIFVVRPGADASNIRVTFEGANETILNDNDNIELHFDCGKIVQRAPLVYQVVNDIPHLISGRHIMQDGEIRFEIGDAYDKTKPLVVGPTLDYLSFLGGTGEDRVHAIAVDPHGYAYVTGETTSLGFPAAATGTKRKAGSVALFVTKFRIADSHPVYTTFLGGQSQDRAFALATDPGGNAYVCGETLSPDFPADALGTPRAGESWDVFVAKLNASGSKMDFSRRFGGSSDDRAFGLALDQANNVYIAGETCSADFPAVNAFSPPHGSGNWDAFVVKLDSSGEFLHYATCIGGSGEDNGYAVAVDKRGCAYVAGATASKDFPCTESFQPRHAGGNWDAFVAKLAPSGKDLTYASYLGGANDDRAYGVAVDLARNVYVTGESASGDFPNTNAVQPYHAGGNWDVFVTKLADDGLTPVYSTYLGGSGDDRGFAVAADPYGCAHVVGETTSSNLLTVNPVQSLHKGGTWDGLAAKLAPGGRNLVYSTYVGGAEDDHLYSVAIDPGRGAHFAGRTVSTDLPVVNPLQSSHKGGVYDALIGKIPAEFRPGPQMRVVPAGGQPGGPGYDFYISTFEITNDELVRFLNDAQANPDNPRGSNMFFDDEGNVWFNPAMEREQHDMFNVVGNRIVYNGTHSPGSRYSVGPELPPEGGSYSNHPVVGVSWFGAVKYCNWLTIDTGRGTENCCYREGTNMLDWAPLSCSTSNWSTGFFDKTERERWLELKGFRLPMDNCHGNLSTVNPFNEFYKAAAWAGGTNMPYGYGRATIEKGDANYLDYGAFAQHGTTPVGFFNGTDHNGIFRTRSNDNFYGVYDMSGGASEWLTDPGTTNSPVDRACYGGSWLFSLPELSERFYVSPFFTDRFRGLRVVSTAPTEHVFLIRIPYRICMCGYSKGIEVAEEPEEKPEVAEKVPEEEEEEEEEKPEVRGFESPGLLYKPAVAAPRGRPRPGPGPGPKPKPPPPPPPVSPF